MLFYGTLVNLASTEVAETEPAPPKKARAGGAILWGQLPAGLDDEGLVFFRQQVAEGVANGFGAANSFAVSGSNNMFQPE